MRHDQKNRIVESYNTGEYYKNYQNDPECTSPPCDEIFMYRTGTTKKLLLNIRRTRLKFRGPITKKESLDDLPLIRHVEGNRNSEKYGTTNLTSLRKWMETVFVKE